MQYLRYETVQAIQQAILRGDTYYEWVELPAAQRTGTATQIASYSLIQAGRVYTQLIEGQNN